MTTDDILHRLEADQRRKTAEVRKMLVDEGRPDLADDLDRRMHAINNGSYGAGSAWHALSDAQRRLLLQMLDGNCRLVRIDGTRMYDIWRPTSIPTKKAARLATVRNLADRELLAWDGGAFDPERAAVVTERGRFVAKHGPKNMHWLNGGGEA